MTKETISFVLVTFLVLLTGSINIWKLIFKDNELGAGQKEKKSYVIVRGYKTTNRNVWLEKFFTSFVRKQVRTGTKIILILSNTSNVVGVWLHR